MKNSTVFTVLLVLISLTRLKAQINPLSTVRCNFIIQNRLYTCHIAGQSLNDDENANIIITGTTHILGRNDANVQRVHITGSTLPFIITQLFTRFPNLLYFSISGGGLTRIQPFAFQNALNLRTVTIDRNRWFREIQPEAFAGASSILQMHLNLNQIEQVYSTSFNGLTSIRTLSLSGNLIAKLPANVFLSLTALDNILLSTNRLHTINGTLFANNRNLVRIDLARNNINAIGSNFLNRLTRLNHLNLLMNRCSNDVWVIGGNTTISSVEQDLSVCFDNAENAPPANLTRLDSMN